jgi:hypothetical protein
MYVVMALKISPIMKAPDWRGGSRAFAGAFFAQGIALAEIVAPSLAGRLA